MAALDVSLTIDGPESVSPRKPKGLSAIQLRRVAWVLRVLIFSAVALLCVAANSFSPAVAFALTVVPGILFVAAVLAGNLRLPQFLSTVHPIESVLYRWLGVGLVKQIVATRLWPILVGVVPPPRPRDCRDFFDYTESATKGAEICHWPTFVLANIAALACLAVGKSKLAIWILAFNIMLNGYPIMLQRFNRWRVHELRMKYLRVRGVRNSP